MHYKYSKSTGCFYPSDTYYPSLPADLIEVTQEAYAAAMSRPAGATLDVVDGALVIVPAPAPTREATIARITAQIKAERDRRKVGGVRVGDVWYHSDDSSRIQQMGLVMMGQNIPAGLRWKALDGSMQPMTPALASAIFAAAAVSDQAIFAKAEQHIAALKASADPAAYDYTTGWPATYLEPT